MDSLTECDIESWRKITLEWVNCLQLIKTAITDLKDLTDGSFFREILILLFHRKVDEEDITKIFSTLQECLQGSYVPDTWVNFRSAQDGDAAEILKMIVILIGVSAFQAQEEADVFRVRPAERLSTSTQHSVRAFLLAVHNNKKIVAPSFLRLANEHKVVDRRAKVPRVLFPQKDASQRNLWESRFPDWSAKNVSDCSSPLGKLFEYASCDPDQLNAKLMAEKDSEIARLLHKVKFLSNLEQDAQDELAKYKSEVSKLQVDLDERNKAMHMLQERINFQNEVAQNTFDASTAEDKANYEQAISELRDRLKKEERKMDKLETENFNLKILLEEQTTDNLRQQDRIRQVEKENRRVHQELNLTIEKRQAALAEINNQASQLQDLEKYCEELQQIVESDRNRRKTRFSSSATPISSSSLSHPSERDSTSENLAQSVVDVQLKDALAESGQLQEQFNNFKRKVDEERVIVQKEVEGLELKLKTVQAQLHLRETEIESLQEEREKERIVSEQKVEDLEQKLKSAQSQLHLHEEKIESLQKQSDQERMKTQSEIEALELELNNAHSQLHLRETEIESLQRQMEIIQDQREKERITQHEELEGRELKLKSLQSQVHLHEAEIESLLQQIESLQEQNELQLMKTRKEAEALEQELKSVQSQLHLREAEIENLQQQIEILQEQSEKERIVSQKEVEELEQKLKSLQSQVHLHETEIEMLHQQIRSLQEQNDKERMKTQKDVEAQELKLKNVQLQLHLRDTEIESLHQQIESLQQQSEKERIEQQEEVEGLEQKLKSGQSRLHLCEEEIESLHQKIESLHEQNENERLIMQKTAEDMKLELKSTQSQLHLREAEIENLQRQMEILQDQHKRELVEMKQAEAALQGKLEISQTHLTENVAKITELISENELLRNASQISNEAIKNLQREIEKSKSEVEDERVVMQKVADDVKLELKCTQSQLRLREAEVESLQEQSEKERLKTQKEVEGLELKLKSVQSQLHLREVEIESIQKQSEKERAEMKQTEAALQENLQIAQSKITENEVQLSELISENGLLKNEKQFSNEAIQKLEQERKELMALIEREREEMNSKYGAVQERVKVLSEGRAVLGTQFSEKLEEKVQDAIAKTKSELQVRYSARFESMKQQLKAMASKELDEKESKIVSMQDVIESLKKERAELRAGNIELNNIIFKLRAEVECWKKKHNESNRPQAANSLTMGADAVSMRKTFRSRDCNLERSVSTLSVESAVSNTSIGSRFKAVPNGSGTLFTCEDEDGLEFNEKNLARLTSEPSTIFDADRVQEIQRRNTLLPPHMRSCYPAEFQFLDSNLKVDEENIRVPDVCLPETFKQRTSQARRATVHQGKIPFMEITNRQR